MPTNITTRDRNVPICYAIDLGDGLCIAFYTTKTNESDSLYSQHIGEVEGTLLLLLLFSRKADRQVLGLNRVVWDFDQQSVEYTKMQRRYVSVPVVVSVGER